MSLIIIVTVCIGILATCVKSIAYEQEFVGLCAKCSEECLIVIVCDRYSFGVVNSAPASSHPLPLSPLSPS